MTLYDTLAGLWRTAVPLIVGTLAGWLAHAGIGIDSAELTAWLSSAFAAAYYALFHALEVHVSPRWGWLLGLARPPRYPDKNGAITLTAARNSLGLTQPPAGLVPPAATKDAPHPDVPGTPGP